MRAHGTALDIVWRHDQPGSAWRVEHIALSSGLAARRDISFGDAPIIVDEIAVYDRGANRLLSLLALGMAMLALLLGAIGLALRERWR